MKKISLIIVMTSNLLFNNSANSIDIIYPNTNEEGNKSIGYLLLKLALKKSGEKFNLVMPKVKINNSRARKMLTDKEISICDFGTSPIFEKDYRAIYFPMYMGLLGHRMFIIHKDKKAQFDSVRDLKSLKKFTAGQGIGWFDAELLKQAKLNTFLAPHLKNLFMMVKHKRIDYLPLGVNEIFGLLEAQDSKGNDLYIEPNILLVYPFSRFYFVHKDNKVLHDIVEKGLKIAFSDGSFQKLLQSNKDFSRILAPSFPKNKKIIRINNPYLTKRFKTIPKKYFYKLNLQ